MNYVETLNFKLFLYRVIDNQRKAVWKIDNNFYDAFYEKQTNKKQFEMCIENLTRQF